MYNIVPLILILISLSIIIIIVVRKFSVLANLDVENIPKEKEAKFKEQIISSRLKRNVTRWTSKLMRVARPIFQAMGNFFKLAYNKLYELRESYKSETILRGDKVKEKIDELLKEAGELIKKEELAEAERRLIEIVNLDNKNIRAFKTLGELYFEGKNFEEAKQTLEHVLKLEKEEDEELYFDLSLVYKEMGNMEAASANIKKALRIEPNNPRFLDTMFEISIINKDKAGALDSYKRLKEVNPENQKLADFKKQIDEL